MSRATRASELALKSADVRDFAGVRPSTLQYWVERAIVAPTLLPGDGHRRDRFWSAGDAVQVRAVKALRDAGCPLDVAATCRPLIDAAAADTSDLHLVWTGKPPLQLTPWAPIRKASRGPDSRAMFHLAVLPVREWSRQAVRRAQQYDLAGVRAERQRRDATNPRRAPTVDIHLEDP
jgi:DNA-binding transcriptional MerR regulator